MQTVFTFFTCEIPWIVGWPDTEDVPVTGTNWGLERPLREGFWGDRPGHSGAGLPGLRGYAARGGSRAELFLSPGGRWMEPGNEARLSLFCGVVGEVVSLLVPVSPLEIQCAVICYPRRSLEGFSGPEGEHFGVVAAPTMAAHSVSTSSCGVDPAAGMV